jgi:hypothetical protein
MTHPSRGLLCCLVTLLLSACATATQTSRGAISAEDYENYVKYGPLVGAGAPGIPSYSPSPDCVTAAGVCVVMFSSEVAAGTPCTCNVPGGGEISGRTYNNR